MANKRTPQTLKKRQRERDKQMQRQEKIARKIERNSQKRLAKQEGTVLFAVKGAARRRVVSIVVAPAAPSAAA